MYCKPYMCIDQNEFIYCYMEKFLCVETQIENFGFGKVLKTQIDSQAFTIYGEIC